MHKGNLVLTWASRQYMVNIHSNMLSDFRSTQLTMSLTCYCYHLDLGSSSHFSSLLSLDSILLNLQNKIFISYLMSFVSLLQGRLIFLETTQWLDQAGKELSRFHWPTGAGGSLAQLDGREMEVIFWRREELWKNLRWAFLCCCWFCLLIKPSFKKPLNFGSTQCVDFDHSRLVKTNACTHSLCILKLLLSALS